jgi:hypothetical protein
MQQESEYQKAQTEIIKWLKQSQEIRRKNKMSSKIFEALKTIDYQDVAVRALWTAVQAFLAVFLLASEQIINSVFTGDWEGSYALIIATAVAGLAAAISAVKTLVLSIAKQLKSVV